MPRLPIQTLPGFFVDENGLIYGPDDTTVTPRRIKNTKYLIVDFYSNGKQFTRMAHRVICEAFHGSPPSPKAEVDHINQDKEDNRPTNLRWAADRFEHETYHHGPRIPQPAKPRPDFPLTPCPNGLWRKIVNKRAYYFGSWRSDPRGEVALIAWLTRKDGIYAGLDHIAGVSNMVVGDITVGKLMGDYLLARSKDVTNKHLAPETYRDYDTNLSDFSKVIGPGANAASLKPSHFATYRATLETRKLGPHATKRVIACIKAAFNYAMDQEWITPVRFGREFAAPNTDSESVALHHLRRGQENRTEVILGRRSVRKLLRATRDKPRWRAMILLMLNTAINPAELARLHWDDFNLESGRLRRRRWKTGIWQECYLWKRTRKALKAILPIAGDLVFTRANGKPLVDVEMVSELNAVQQQRVRVHRSNRISRPFRELAESARLSGITPYTLRRTARTVAAHCDDDNAAKRMMGQRLAGRDQTYIKGQFPLARLKRLAMTIYRRLFQARNSTPPSIDAG